MIRTARFASIVLIGACGAASAGTDDGTFRRHHISLGHSVPAVLAHDVDGDGDIDLLAVGDGVVTVLTNDGSGHFDVGPRIEAGSGGVHLSAGDLDGDGALDLAVANHETDYLTILGGVAGEDPADGAIRTPWAESRRLPLDVGPHPHEVEVRDVNGDGRLDILVDDRQGEAIAVLLGDGAGDLVPGDPIDVGGDPYRGWGWADVDGDGAADLLAPTPRCVTVRRARGGGAFDDGGTLCPPWPPFTVAGGDVDGDGHDDVAAGSGENRGQLVFWWGTGSGGPAEGPVLDVSTGPTRVLITRLDDDALDDVIVTSWVGSELAVIRGRSDRALVVERIGVEGNPWGAAVADLDGDGRRDIAVGLDGGDGVELLFATDPVSR